MMTKINRRKFLIASSASIGIAAAMPNALCTAAPRVRVVGLKVDNLDQPLGLENRFPRLSWQIESNERNIRQSAYRILVASSEEALEAGRGDLWDSGRIESPKSV